MTYDIVCECARRHLFDPLLCCTEADRMVQGWTLDMLGQKLKYYILSEEKAHSRFLEHSQIFMTNLWLDKLYESMQELKIILKSIQWSYLSPKIPPFLKSEDPRMPHWMVKLNCSSSALESQEIVVSPVKKAYDLQEAGDHGSFLSALPEPIDFAEGEAWKSGLDGCRAGFAQ